jgi:hypothetical protein
LLSVILDRIMWTDFMAGALELRGLSRLILFRLDFLVGFGGAMYIDWLRGFSRLNWFLSCFFRGGLGWLWVGVEENKSSRWLCKCALLICFFLGVEIFES